MPDRRDATLLEELPEEIIDKILIWLPSKDIGRCRAVSTSWRSATSTPGFMLEHHRRQPSLPIINGHELASLVVFRDTGAEQLWPFIPGFRCLSENRLLGACDGFIILISRGSLRYQFHIYNPVIRKQALLPEPQGRQSFYNTIIGFYRYHPTGEYRVLWLSLLDPYKQSPHLSESSLYIHTVGANESRHVRFRMSIVPSPFVEQKLLKELSYLIYYPPPVRYRESLHWCPNGHYRGCDITGDGGSIVVFDTESESFRWMRSPIQPLCAIKKLFIMKGALGFCGCSPAVMNVWVMQDYDAEIWAFKYRIDLSRVEVSRQLYFTSLKNKKETPLDTTVEEFNDMAVLNERELLIKFNRKYVLRCDIDGNFLGMVNTGKSQYYMMLTQHCLQETIMPIPSHGMHG